MKRKLKESEGQDKIKKRCLDEQKELMSKFQMTPDEVEVESAVTLEEVVEDTETFPPPIQPGDVMFPDIDIVDMSNLDDQIEGQKEAKPKRKRESEIFKRNLLPIPNTSEASLRYGLSSTETAAVASVYLLDLIKGGHLTEEARHLTLDSAKVKRGRDKVMERAKEDGDRKSLEDNIEGILADGRKDKTMCRTFNEETGRFHTRVKKRKPCDHSF